MVVRFTTVRKIWESCKALLKQGLSEYRDAYVALAVFAEYLLPPVQLEDESLFQRKPKKFGIDYFDIREDPLFWNELKAGLVSEPFRLYV